MADRAATRPRWKAQQQAVFSRRVVEVAKGVSATLGADFFRLLVNHLADVFQADYVYLGELAGTPPDRIRTLADSRGSESQLLEQGLSGTASGQVVTDGIFACRKGVRLLFPLDALANELEGEGYCGFRLTGSAGQLLGLLSMISSKPFENLSLAKSVVEAFTQRAAAELERKRNEDMRRESEERHKAFIANSPDAMWRIELEQPVPLSAREEEQIDGVYRFGYVAECNDAMARLAGAAHAEDLVGLPFAEVAQRANPEAREELRGAVRAGFRAVTVETSPRDAAGEQVYRSRSQFGIVQDGALRRIWGTTRDITNLRQAELSLSASERRFREVMQGIQLPVVMLDSAGAITFVNEYLAGLVQRSSQELSSLSWLSGIVPIVEVETWKKALQPDARGRAPALQFEGLLIGRNGQQRLIAWDTIALYDANNQPAGVAAIGRDLTRQRALEKQIREMQSLEIAGRVAAGIAQEFNSLLTVVIGHTSLLAQEIPKSDSRHEALNAIQNAALQCTSLTRQLLAFGRRQPLHPAVISLNNVITGDRRVLRSLVGRNTKLVLDLDMSVGWVFADSSQMRQVIANLVANASDATPAGGEVVISTSKVLVVKDDAQYPAVEPGSYVRLMVTDGGAGIPDEIREHMFEPFFTTKQPGKGTGLGLSTVHGIVVQSGGHVFVYSEPDRGTRVEILLPEHE